MSTEYYHVRISPTKQNPFSDFAIFMCDMVTNRRAIWDKDKLNKIKTGDYLAFIAGPVGHELVYIFKVIEELALEMRPDHWELNNPYTKNNGITAVSDRMPIMLTNVHSLPKTCEWCEIRRSTGLGNSHASWMPRGTQRVKNKHLLPFPVV
jgi:hypothetical protein